MGSAITKTIDYSIKEITNDQLTQEDCIKFLQEKSILDMPFSKNREYSPSSESIRLTTNILQGKEISLNTIPIFNTFVICNSQWSLDKGWIFFRDHPLSKKHTYVERHHKEPGLSYMDAPIILNHYLISMYTTQNTGTINSLNYLKNIMKDEPLSRHILSQSGSSFDFLMNIMGYTNYNSIIRPKNNDPQIPYYLLNYGPALVSCFDVERSFLEGKYSYLNYQPMTPYIGKHSLLLIGHRKKKDGEVMYLLQSTWTHNMFIEVNVEYMNACEAKLTFCKKIKNSPHFEININPYIEIDQYGDDDGIINLINFPTFH